ncbi:MAG: MarR family transcriptional regulator [Sedimentisphaerales bacterium]|nr:MarR family transcriptional regulator [Sedimentisphaerales bacterium]
MPSNKTIDKIVEFARGLEGIEPGLLREGLEIADLHRRMHTAIEQLLAGVGVNFTQVEILEVLFHNQDVDMTPAMLSEEVGLSRSAMTNALDGLERLGYTSRMPHPSDRRMIVACLTEQGREFASRLLPGRYQKLCKVVGLLSKEARDLMLKTYRDVLDFLTKEMEQEQG